MNQAQFAGLYVAIEKGFFAREGLSVTVKEFQSGSPLADLENGTSQFAYASANEVLGAFADGADIHAIAAFYQVSPYVVVSLKETNITSPRQFIGKRIGIKGGRGAEGYSIFSQLLNAAALTEDDVIVDLLPLTNSEKDDLVNGRADAIGMYRTRLHLFDSEGIRYSVLYPEQYGSALYNDVLTVTQEYASQYPDQIEGFVRALVRGWEYTIKHPDEAIDITLQYVTREDYKDRAYEAYILEQSIPLIKPTNRSSVGMMEVSRWQRAYDSLQERGLLSREFDIADLLITDLVK